MRPSLMFIVALPMALSACEDGRQPTPPSPASETAESPGDASEYLVLPEVGRVDVAGSCESEGPDGPVLTAELATGGTLQLRKLPEGVLHVSALPSPEADPVGTRSPSDTTWSETAGFVSGSSVLWLDDTRNRIVVEFRLRWDESVPACIDTEVATPAAVPTPLVPEHGGTYWGVYLAVGEGPELEDANAYLREGRGIAAIGGGSVECDEGARKALGPDAGPLTVAVYFETEEDARAWAETLPAAPVAIAEVRTFCLD